HLTNRLVPSGNLLAAKRESRKKGTPVNQVLKPYRSRHSVVLLLVALGFALKTNAQAPPGPMAGAPSKDSLAPATKIAGPADAPRIKNLSGSWRLNPEESDDPARKLQQASSSGGGYGGGRRVGMGGGWPGGGGWPAGGGHGGYGGRGQG